MLRKLTRVKDVFLPLLPSLLMYVHTLLPVNFISLGYVNVNRRHKFPDMKRKSVLKCKRKEDTWRKWRCQLQEGEEPNPQRLERT